MNIKYILKDELGNVGQSIALVQGETKTISCFFLDQNGATLALTQSITELVAKIFEGVSTPSLQKKLSLSAVTLISGNGGTIGFSFSLSGSDTTALPVSSTVNMSAVISGSGFSYELDMPAALNVASPLITN